jgi:hypothetical protein
LQLYIFVATFNSYASHSIQPSARKRWPSGDWISLTPRRFSPGYTPRLKMRGRDYGEKRFISAGLLQGRLVVLVWTPRGAARRIISMRHAHAEEETRWRQYLG